MQLLLLIIIFTAVGRYGNMAMANNYQPSEALLDAIEYVESVGDADAIGDGGQAVGAYQLHTIYVDEVNRILGKKKYNYKDRYSKEMSRKMTMIYLTYWARYHRLIDDVMVSRLHNGSPITGHKTKATENYAAKIKAAMKKRKDKK